MSATTISQALRQINKLRSKAREQYDRAKNAIVWEGDDRPAWPFAASVEAADAAIDELVALETRLRVTNAVTKISWDSREISLSQATCLLQQWKGKIAWLKTLPSRAQAERKTVEREYTVGGAVAVEKITHCDFIETKRADAIAALQTKFDTLNDAVESANHRTVLQG